MKNIIRSICTFIVYLGSLSNARCQITVLDSFPYNHFVSISEDSNFVYWCRNGNSGFHIESLNKKTDIITVLQSSNINCSQAYFSNNYLIYFNRETTTNPKEHIYGLHIYDYKNQKAIVSISKISVLNYNTVSNYQFGLWVSNDNYLYLSIENLNSYFIGKINLENGKVISKIPTNAKPIKIYPLSGKLLVSQKTDTTVSFTEFDTNLVVTNISTFKTIFTYQNNLAAIYQKPGTLVFDYCRDSISADGNVTYCIATRKRFGNPDSISELLVSGRVNALVTEGKNFAIMGNQTNYFIYQNGILKSIATPTDHTGINTEITFINNSRYFRYFNPLVGWEYGYFNDSFKLVLFGDINPGNNSSWNPYNRIKEFVIGERLYCFIDINKHENGIGVFDKSLGLIEFYKINNNINLSFPIDLRMLDTSILVLGYSNISKRDNLLLKFNKSTAITNIKPQPYKADTLVESPTWFREFASVYTTGYPSIGSNYTSNQVGIYLDNENNCTGVFAKNGITRNYTTTLGSANYSVGNGCQYIYHYNSVGKPIWSATFGDHPWSLTKSVYDLKSNVIWIIAPCNGNFTYADSMLHKGITGIIAMKIEAKTGKLLWSEVLNPGQTPYSIEVDELTIDDEGNVYAACLTKNTTTQIGAHTIQTWLSPANILLKLQSNGTLEWAKAMVTPWTDQYGNTRVLDYDIKAKKIIAIQSQGFRNVWSSCKYKNWYYYHQFIDKNGNLSGFAGVESSDLGGITSGAFNSYGQFVAHGFFRGDIQIGKQNFSTRPQSGCFKTETFNYFFGSAQKSPQKVWLSNERIALSYKTKRAGNYLYTLNVDEKNNLFIYKQNQLGKTIGVLNLKQSADFWEYYSPVSFDINDSFIVISYGNYHIDSTFIKQVGQYNEATNIYTGILKIRNTGWVDVAKNEPESNAVDFSVVPNPASDFLFITLPSDVGIFNSYNIYDLTGKLVLQNSLLANEKYVELRINTLPAGAYVLQLTGTGVSKSKKIIKM